MRRAAPVLLLVTLAIWLYGTKLTSGSLRSDEIQLASHAQALAAGEGRQNGARWPLFVNTGQDAWLAPFPLYAGVGMMKLRSFSAPGIRWVPLLIGTLNVLLIYLVADRVFGSRALAFVAGMILVLSPAYCTYSRLATQDGVWPLPFVAGWLLSVSWLLEGSAERQRLIVVGGGAGILAGALYAQPSAAVLVPLLVCVSIVVVFRRPGGWRPSDVYVACAAFALVSLPLFLWFALHPSIYAQTFGRWLWMLHPRSVLNWGTLAICSGFFWDFLSPSHLFVSDSGPAFAGVFLLPVGILIVRGIFEVLRKIGSGEPQRPIHGVMLAGFVLGPLAAATFEEPLAIQRALIIVPFGVLLATFGLQILWTTGRHVSRGVVILLLVAVPLQFSFWYRGSLGSRVAPVSSERSPDPAVGIL